MRIIYFPTAVWPWPMYREIRGESEHVRRSLDRVPSQVKANKLTVHVSSMLTVWVCHNCLMIMDMHYCCSWVNLSLQDKRTFVFSFDDHEPKVIRLSYLNFHPLEAVARYRDPQLQVGENYSYLFNFSSNIYRSWCLSTHFIPDNC